MSRYAVWVGLAVVAFTAAVVPCGRAERQNLPVVRQMEGPLSAFLLEQGVSWGHAEVIPQNTLPGAAREYELQAVPSAGGTSLTRGVELLPGINRVQVRAGGETVEHIEELLAVATNLRVRLTWVAKEFTCSGTEKVECGATLLVVRDGQDVFTDTKYPTNANEEMVIEYDQDHPEAGVYAVYVLALPTCWQPTAGWNEVKANVSVTVDDTVIGGGEKTLMLGTYQYGGGHLVSFVIHQGHKTGGYRVIEHQPRLGSGPTIPVRDMVAEQGQLVAGSWPRGELLSVHEWSFMTVDNSTGPVYLPVGGSVQFEVEGQYRLQPSPADALVSGLLFDRFQVEVISGDNPVVMDGLAVGPSGLGVLSGLSPGHVKVKCLDEDDQPMAREIDVYIVKVDMAMDGNLDLKIDFSDHADKHCLFWLNDDHDTLHLDLKDRWIEDDNVDQKSMMGAVGPNHSDNTIGARSHAGGTPPMAQEDNCLRDLEDFTAIQIQIPKVVSQLSGITYWMKFEAPYTDSAPEVNLFKAITPDPGDPFAYLTNQTVAAEQIQETLLYHIDAGECQIDANLITFDEPITFLMEGKHEGSASLAFIIKKDNAEICRDSVVLDLRPITNFYDVYEVGREERTKRYRRVEVDADATPVQSMDAYSPNKNYLLFVHGWNLDGPERRSFAETAFKRLWWQGYKGRFGLFDWPTLSGFDWRSIVMKPVKSAHHYDDSEMIAWLSSKALANLMATLNANGELRVWAHSMGNVVTGEALRRYSGAAQIRRYIATQAAIPASMYSQTTTSTDFKDWLPTSLNIFSLGPSTPNIYAYWHSGNSASNDSPYLVSNMTQVAGMVHYYNTEDYALRRWELNNRRKPDGAIGYRFNYGGSLDEYAENASPNLRFYRGADAPLNILNTDNLRDRYAVFAYAAESRSLALGRQSRTGSDPRDLVGQGMNFDDRHYSHSRQFRSNVNEMWKYYVWLTEDGEL